jgi:predicted nucleic-acid-binding Zn-ribbon protein
VGSEISAYIHHPAIYCIYSGQWAVKISDIERDRVQVFVNCLDCGYYMLFKPEIVGIF